MSSTKPILYKVLVETQQAHETRKGLLAKLETTYGRPVLSFFTSFYSNTFIEDTDVDMIEGLLAKMNLKKGLLLVISSPGGIGESAERIINICKQYSGTKEFWVLVPNKAKSAATMVCFGASKILMLPTSELGPVDPQIKLAISDGEFGFSVCNIIDSHEELFNNALKADKEHIAPYLQQLQYYDPRIIAEYKQARDLANDISVKALKQGMMSNLSETKIKEKIKIFLTPGITKTHGRAIFTERALRCGLKIEKIELNTPQAGLIQEIYVRTNNFVNKHHKCIETKNESFTF